MANINLYTTLADLKAYQTSRGGTMSTDTADDTVIVDLIERASRYMDDRTRRQFYPSIEADTFNTPNGSQLLFDQDVLQVISLTNGDGTSIASTEYTLQPANFTPHYSLTLKQGSTVSWLADSNNNTEQVISASLWCGYREHFTQRAWQSVGTLGAAITDTTTLAFTMTGGHTVVVGQILKVDSEIYNISTVATNTITPIARGDNGSTAATHTNGATVYKWVAQEEVAGAVLEITNSAYHRRMGQSIGESATITAAGIVLSPKDIPQTAVDIINSYRRTV